MSYEQMIDHLKGELRAGAMRRQRRERRVRRVGAVLLAAAVIVGVTAVVARAGRDDSSVVSTTPAMTDAQRAVCRAHAAIHAASRIFDLDAMAAASVDLRAAADAVTDDELRELGRAVAAATDESVDDLSGGDTEPSDESATEEELEQFRVSRQLTALCTSLGHPDFTPVIGMAPLPPPPDVPIGEYGAPQLFERSSDLPPGDYIGAGIRIAGLVRSDAGGYVMQWALDGTDGTTSVCTATGVGLAESGQMGATCSSQGGGPTVGTPQWSGLGNIAATIATEPGVSFVVLDFGATQLVQQPVFGRTVFVWADQPDLDMADAVIQSYDADGRELGCVRVGRREC